MNRRIVWSWCMALAFGTALQAAAEESSLVVAAKHRDLAAVRAMLAEGADVKQPQADGSTALHWAAHWDDLELANTLLVKGAPVNAVTDYASTPLSLAVVNGSTAMVKRLLDAGANPNLAMSTGETPLMTSTRAGHVEIVKALIAGGADVNAFGGGRDQTALMWAVSAGQHEVMRVLLQAGADINARSAARREYVSFGRGDPQGGRLRGHADGTLESDGTRPGVRWIQKGGFTPLLFAAQQGDLKAAELLLAAGANVDDTTLSPASSALMLAAYNDHGAVAKLLLDKGADPNFAGAGHTALHLAVARKNGALVEQLLARGAKPNVPLTMGTPRTDDLSGRSILLPEYLVGATPFLLASALNEVGMMRALLSAGADPQLAMQDGTTPLMAAMGINPGILGLPAFRRGTTRRNQDGYTKVAASEERLVLDTVKLVLEVGVDVNRARTGGVVYHGTNPRTQIGRGDGDTALHTATADKLQSVVEYLVEHGARLDLKNQWGLTPLAMATSDRGLIASGADDGGGKLGDPAVADSLRRLGAQE